MQDPNGELHRRIIMKLSRLLLCASVLPLLAACSVAPLPARSVPPVNSDAGLAKLVARSTTNPIARPFWFEANIGQYPSAVQFLYRGPRHVAAILSDGVELRWSAPSANAGVAEHSATRSLRLRFMGAGPAAKLRGEAPLQATANYFIGNDARYWRHDIPLYGAVVAPVRPGVDARYYGHDGRLEFDLLLAKGVDPGLIQIKLDSPAPVHIDERGDLVVVNDGSASARVVLHAPAIYQRGNHGNEPVAGRYVQLEDGRISLVVGRYDRERPLVVDPVLSYSSYLGGSSSDAAYAVATDATDSVYVAGYTTSPDMPLQNAYQNAMNGASAYVAKFSPSGAGLALSYATYIGNDVTEVRGLAVDNKGSAYITGSTSSNTFPLFNPLQDHNAGGIDGYVVKLNATGNALSYATYFGGNSVDRGRAIAVDAAGNAYICGATSSADFPIAGQGQRTFSGVVDAFVFKLAPDGRTLGYSTLIGGTGGDYAEAITVDATGSNVYTAGHTDSNDFPVLKPVQPGRAGGVDALLVKLDSHGTIAASTYLGGSLDDTAYAVDIDGDGYIYVAGQTVSNDFPIGGPAATGRGYASVVLHSVWNLSGYSRE